MSETPAWLQQRVAQYYEETTRESYLVWAGSALGLHLGLDADFEGVPASGIREALDRSILAMNALLADRAGVEHGMRVLDAGCGVGGSSIWLAKERGARVTGMTLDAGQVDLAQRFARERGVATLASERDSAPGVEFSPSRGVAPLERSRLRGAGERDSAPGVEFSPSRGVAPLERSRLRGAGERDSAPGVEFSPSRGVAPLERSRLRGAGERDSAPGVEFERGDFAASGRANGSFDVVWNLESLCHVEDATGYVRSARDLLVEGGRFVCADFFRDRGGPDCDAMCEGWVLPALRSPAEIAQALEGAGFVEVKVIDLRARVLAAARVMCSMAFHEIVRIEAAVGAGESPSSSYRRHFDASIAACTGLESREIAYALVSARRPNAARA